MTLRISFQLAALAWNDYTRREPLKARALSELTGLGVARDVAMQIAALNPVAVDAASVPADVIAREKDIIMELMKQDPKMAGKTDDMIAKIADGKMSAFFKEQTLLAQAFVKDAGKSVADYLKGVDADLKVTAFKRVALG